MAAANSPIARVNPGYTTNKFQTSGEQRLLAPCRKRKVEHTLSVEDQADLTWYWRDADAIIGLKSNMQAQIDALNASSTVREKLIPKERPSGIRLALDMGQRKRGPLFPRTEPTIYVPKPTHTMRAPERTGLKIAAAKRANRIGAILVRLDPRCPEGSWTELVLFGMYGMEEPPTWHITALGEFSRIAGLTAMARNRSRNGLREAVAQPMVRVRTLAQCTDILATASLAYTAAREAQDREAGEDRVRILLARQRGYFDWVRGA